MTQPCSSIVEAVYQMPSQSHCSSLTFWKSALLAQAVRVRHEAIAAALVVERIEQHREPVVAEHLLALAQDARRDLARVAIVESRGDVDRVRVVQQIDDRALGGRRVLGRLDLVQVLELGRELPGCLVEHAVDDGRRCRADDADGFLAGAVGQRFLAPGRQCGRPDREIRRPRSGRARSDRVCEPEAITIRSARRQAAASELR